MKLPANYSHTIYKFRPSKLNSGRDFLRIKSTEKIDYLDSIKRKLKKEYRIYLRHHGGKLISYLLSILTALVTIILLLIAELNKFGSILIPRLFNIILLLLLMISIIVIILLRLRGFPNSFSSFRKYLKEKFNYYRSLKDRIDNCKDFKNYKEQSI
jgi:hypothetical protein